MTVLAPRREADRAPKDLPSRAPVRKRTGHRLAAAALAVAGAAWAVGGSLLLFPLLSDNNDEAVNLLQAETLSSGRLFPEAPEHWESFLPWLHAHDGGVFVSKFNPVWPAFLAAAKVTLGSERAALAASAAAVLLTTYLLSLQILRNRRQAVLAMVLATLSPIFLIQSTMFLSYLPTLALLQGFGAALLAGLNRSSRPLFVLSGFLGALAGFSRPFDLILFALPLGGWLAYVHRRNLRLLIVRAGWVALGAFAPALAMFWYFDAATGSPFGLPFNLLDPADRFGFGLRRMVPEWGYTSYTPVEALQGLAGHLALSSFWFFGGLPMFGLGLAVLRRTKRTRPIIWLGWTMAAVPMGYFFFWGSYGSIEWGGPSRMGPFYYILLLTPLAVLGAGGLARLWHWDHRLAAAAWAGMLALSVWVVTDAVARNRTFTEERRELYGPLLDVELDNALVFLPSLQGPWLMQPFALARNSATLDGPVVWALDRGHDRNLEAAGDFPERTPYVLEAEGLHRSVRPSLNFDTHLERYRVVSGTQVTVEVILANFPPGPVRLEVHSGLRIDSFDYVVPAGAARIRLPLAVGVGSSRFTAPELERTTSAAPEEEDELEVSALRIDAAGEPELIGRDRIEINYRGATVEMFLPVAGPPTDGETDLYVVPPEAANF